MKVLLINSLDGWGGGEAWCLSAARWLLSRGHSVGLVCRADSELERRAVALPELAIHPLKRSRFERLRAAARVSQVIRQRGYHVALGNIGRDLRLAWPARRRGECGLVQRRGLLRSLRADPINRLLYSKAVDCVVANCHAIAQAMRTSAPFVDNDKFRVIENGVRLPEVVGPKERQTLRSELKATCESVGSAEALETQSSWVLCAGRLAPMKGHSTLLQAWARLEQDSQATVGNELLIAGDGEEQARLQAEAHELGLRHVHWLGYRDDIERWMASSDLFCLASVRDEGCNNALLQAMAAGLPSVVSDLPALTEMIAADSSSPSVGRSFPVGDAEVLSVELQRLLHDQDFATALGQQARLRAATRYDPQRAFLRWEELLQEFARQEVST